VPLHSQLAAYVHSPPIIALARVDVRVFATITNAMAAKPMATADKILVVLIAIPFMQDNTLTIYNQLLLNMRKVV
jgi:hypothetical protein